MQKHYILCIISVLLIACKQNSNTITFLNGNDWEFSEILKPSQSKLLQWKPAKVPGTVQTDLLALEEIPHPFKLNNEDSIQWISERNWVYKKEFTIPAETLQKQQHIIQFEGVDTHALIMINDSVFPMVANAFRTWEFDISKILKPENTLTVTLLSPDIIEKEKAGNLDYELPEAPRVFTRKPQFQYGWDWGPTIKTMGIWNDVSLISYDAVRLKEASIQTDHISETQANLTALVDLATYDYDKCIVEIVNNTTGETNIATIEVYGDKGTYTIPITINDPQLWWTHNLGDPFLYDFTINIKKGNTVIDHTSKKIGLRTIELVTEKDEKGEEFYFKLNGKPVYMKGANYIPQNIFLAAVQPQDREQLVNNVVAANMNMLRVWGGGVYENDLFYDLCDEKGILIWQDFMFACAMYPGDKEFLNNVKAEAIDNVKRLRSHPSIALWCGNNENSEGWHRWGWQAGKTEAQKEEIWNSYKAIFNNILPSVVDSLHASVSYWESSPKYGRGDKRYQFEGDAHDWWVWHDGYPFEHFEEEVPRFMSEFGFQSFPSYKAIKYFTEQDSIDIDHPSFATHQKHSRGFQLIREYMERDYPVPTNDADYVYVSQLLQAHGITKGIKAHRRAKPYNMGTLYWQLNDCWPVVSWSSIDGLGNWKALHYKAKRVFENRLIIPFEENHTLKVKVVDDNPKPTAGEMFVIFKDFNGNTIYKSASKPVFTYGFKNEVVFETDLSSIEFDRNNTYAEVYFGNEKAIHYFVKPKDLQLLEGKITANMKRNEEGIEITVTSQTLQKDVFLFLEKGKGHFNDNFFDLLPNETKTIQLHTQQTDFENIHYKTLNLVKQNKTKIKSPISVFTITNSM